MSRNPWDPDHALDADGARARIAAHAFEPGDVRYLAEGWDFFVFEADGEWLFRFPKRAGELARLEREVALLAVLADRLPVAVPRYAYFAGGFGGYRKIAGVQGMNRPAPAGFGRDLARALTALHATPRADLAGIDLPAADAPPAEARAEVLAKLADAPLDDAVRDRCRALFTAPAPPPCAGPRRLIHGDIFAEHVLIENGALHGILDWGDAGWGDPATDFAIAAFWGVLPEALAHYGGPMDAGLADRARHAAACMIAGQIAFAAVSGKEEFTRDGLAALNRFEAGGDPGTR